MSKYDKNIERTAAAVRRRMSEKLRRLSHVGYHGLRFALLCAYAAIARTQSFRQIRALLATVGRN